MSSAVVKVSPPLFGFGMMTGKNGIRYSDPEKTILDLIYLWRYHGIPPERIRADISGWARGVSNEKLRRYARKYPTTVARIAARVQR